MQPPVLDRRTQLVLANVALVNREIPGFRFQAPRGEDPYFEGWVPDSQGARNYQVRLVLPPGSPDVKPQLYVWHPIELPLKGGGTINAKGTSHEWHTRGNGPDGRVRICHTSSWSASNTYVQVLLKAVLWLDAYSRHLETGESISALFA